MKVNTLVVDDEALARQRLVNLINEVPELSLMGQCSNGQEAITFINEYKPDLVFLDIQMKDMDGFDILKKIVIKKKFILVFVTAHDQYAIKAFDQLAFDYLLKPYMDSRFFKSVNNILAHIKNINRAPFEEKMNELIEYVKTNESHSTNYYKRLPIKIGNKIFFINSDDIIYILASGYYAEIYTVEKKHILRMSLSNLIKSLDSRLFIRVHRSTIININKIEGLINSNFGELDVKMIDTKLFRVSKGYKKDFLTKVKL